MFTLRTGGHGPCLPSNGPAHWAVAFLENFFGAVGANTSVATRDKRMCLPERKRMPGLTCRPKKQLLIHQTGSQKRVAGKCCDIYVHIIYNSLKLKNVDLRWIYYRFLPPRNGEARQTTHRESSSSWLEGLAALGNLQNTRTYSETTLQPGGTHVALMSFCSEWFGNTWPAASYCPSKLELNGICQYVCQYVSICGFWVAFDSFVNCHQGSIVCLTELKNDSLLEQENDQL